MNLVKLDRRISDYCEENHIMGMLRITLKDDIIFEKSFGYANVEEKNPFASDTLFNFYSLSKPFCAIGLLLLKDKGLVDLDAHPGVYLEEARGFDSRITIRHLLYHISGMPDFYDHPDLMKHLGHGYPHEVKEQLKYLWQYDNDYMPGTSGNYNNLNFIILALITEAVSGKNMPTT